MIPAEGTTRIDAFFHLQSSAHGKGYLSNQFSVIFGFSHQEPNQARNIVNIIKGTHGQSAFSDITLPATERYVLYEKCLIPL